MEKLLKRSLALLLSAFLFAMLLPPAAFRASAADNSFESSNIVDDLEMSTINGKQFDLNDYPYDVNAPVQLLSFIEFCYTTGGLNQSQYRLYVYIFNPSGSAINTKYGLNQIEFSCGKDERSYKYPLYFLNRSTALGTEGKFWKFRIDLTSEERGRILSSLDETARVYRVTGIEIAIGNETEEYDILQTITYTGYSKGFDPEGHTGDSLSCKTDGITKYMHLNVHQTTYRPKGTNGRKYYTYDSLTSVYFAIPKETDEEYGEMTRIRGEYLKALTTDIFVTGNDDFYQEMIEWAGLDVGYLIPNTGDFDFTIGRLKTMPNDQNAFIFEQIDKYYNLPQEIVNAYPADEYLSRINYVLKAENGDADTFDISKDGLRRYMEWYTENVGKAEELVAGKYAASLFESVDGEKTTFDLKADSMTKDLRSETLQANWWGGFYSSSSTLYEGKEAIHRVTEDDFIRFSQSHTINKDLTCENLYIGYSDIDDFLKFYDENQSDNVIYLIRFANDEYSSARAEEGHFQEVGHHVLTQQPIAVFQDDADYNAYLAQETVYLLFDIIDIDLTKRDVTTTIPVVMSPVDIIPEPTHPWFPALPSGRDIWQYILIAAGVAAVVVVIVVIVVKRDKKKKGKSSSNRTRKKSTKKRSR